MGRKTVIGIGIAIAAFGTLGVYNAFMSLGEAPEERKDITTKGIVTHLEATELRHQVGVVLDTTYRMYFSFEADNGKTYTGQENVEESQYKRLRKGQKVAVKYHSNNPNINGAPKYGYYVSVDEIPQSSPEFRLAVCSGTLVFGLIVIFLGFKFVVDDKNKPTQSQADFSPPEFTPATAGADGEWKPW